MDDLVSHLEAALWSFLGKAADFCLEVAAAAGRKAVELAAVVAGWVNALAAKVAAVPLWLSIPGGLLVAGLVAAYLLRQRLYDRLLVYHDILLRRRGFARTLFTVARGAVHEEHQVMARQVPLSARFAGLAVYEAVPGRYAVAYGLTDGTARDVRFYRRDRRAGLAAMGEDLVRHFRANVRMLHADGELRALFAILDARDADFAACRPALPGETDKPAARGLVRAAGTGKRSCRTTA
ncbi:MAG: hypothetical protein AAGU21_16415 [Solidesulfovibrio sp.]|uniref:hypothetical protein n=1 Tax=Solidesulfovibrio sp. TaxID=2910990 RepID=UPI002B1FDC71|nr:hypothetical protein [Solidesulfovibrio sp.]MEA4858490.1 hypothetical protein [Solidesulfovibrio sp.]